MMMSLIVIIVVVFNETIKQHVGTKIPSPVYHVAIEPRAYPSDRLSYVDRNALAHTAKRPDTFLPRLLMDEKAPKSILEITDADRLDTSVPKCPGANVPLSLV